MNSKAFIFILILFSQTIVYQTFAENKIEIQKDSIASIKVSKEKPMEATLKEQVKVTDFIIPTALFSYGLIGLNSDGIKDLNLTLKDKIQAKHSDFHTNLDDFSVFVPGGTVFLLNAVGIEGKHNWKDAALIYGGSLLIAESVVTPIKYITKVERPDGSKLNSFPSRHTAIAFASAEFLRREYKDVSPWIGVAGYAVATASGALRMYNNRHWFSDVVAGAGIGIASTNLSYFIYEKLNIHVNDWCYQVVPTYQNKNIGFSFVAVF